MRCLFLTLIMLSCSMPAYADAVDDAFLKNDEVSVIVVLEDSETSNTAGNLHAKKAQLKKFIRNKESSVKKQQEKVISGLFGTDLKIGRKYKTVNSFSGKITKKGLEKLRKDPSVKRIHLNRPVKLFLDSSIPIIKADAVWNLTYNQTTINGTGETVCVIDTGVNSNHPALQGRIIAEHCFCDNEQTDSDGVGCCPNGGITDTNSTDDHGHGAHVIGTIASQNNTYKGVAPGANIVSVKALNASGEGWFSDLAASIDWCVSNAAAYNISVISMSIGDNSSVNDASSCDGYATSNAIDSAVAAGIAVFVASGNDGYSDGITFPACATNAISVGATTDADAVAGFTNTDELLDLLAPGVSVTAPSYTGGMIAQDGTSMATPHAAGAAVLLQQFYKHNYGSALGVVNLKNALKNNGKNITDQDNSLSFPRIDVLAAINSLDTITPTIEFISPTPDNGTYTNETSATINITSSETLTDVFLEFNWTNKTMDGTNTNWFLTIANLTGWNNFTVYGNDSAGNLGSAHMTAYFNNSAPTITSYYPNSTNINIVEPDNQTFNITYNEPDNQTTTIRWYYDGILSYNQSIYDFMGNYSEQGTHNITVIISDGYLNSTNYWNFTINNTNRAPNASNIMINPQNATSGDNISCNYTFIDPDSDNEIDSIIRWYKNAIENQIFENITKINSTNISRNDTWMCSVEPSDGDLFGTTVNSTNITIRNSAPQISTIADVTVAETQEVNITINATDADSDNITYSINDTVRFNQSNNSFIWQTSLTDSGEYIIRINATDGTDTGYQDITITVTDALDSDDDGNPDFNDTDDDNDGINDTIDYLTGNQTSINSSQNITLYINGSADITGVFNGSYTINITENNVSLVDFDYNITNNTKLNLNNITIESESDYILIKGVLGNGLISKKTARFNSSSLGYICIKDAEIDSISNITTGCNGTNEFFIVCNGTNQSGYNCTEEGTKYLVTGLNHSGIKEQCQDNDGDGYGVGCTLGLDFNDADPSKYPGASCSRSCYSGAAYSSGGSCTGGTYTCGNSGGSSSGGGGGGSSIHIKPLSGKSKYFTILTKGDTAEMKVDSPKISVTNIRFSVNKQLSKVTLSVKTANESEAPSAVDDAYAYFEISIDKAEVSDADSVIFNFKVNNSWLKDYYKGSVTLNRYEDGWIRLDTNLISEDSNHTYYTSSSPGLSYFAITAEKQEETPIWEKKVEIHEDEKQEEKKQIENAVTEIYDTENTSSKPSIKENKNILFIILFLLFMPSIIYLIFKLASRKQEKRSRRKKKSF